MYVCHYNKRSHYYKRLLNLDPTLLGVASCFAFVCLSLRLSANYLKKYCSKQLLLVENVPSTQEWSHSNAINDKKCVVVKEGVEGPNDKRYAKK